MGTTTLHLLRPALQDYAWGSSTAIPDFLGEAPGPGPVAEAWFGAHPSAPAPLTAGGTLEGLIADDPVGTLGADVVARFGERLPFLLKLIAPAAPLSLQVHPSPAQAAAGYAAEEAAGIGLDDPARTYRDEQHKPELVYALTTFEALSGFRAPRRAAEILRGLDAPLATRLAALLGADPTSAGVRAAFTALLTSRDVTPAAVADVARACARRAEGGTSPSVRSDAIVAQLYEANPGDPGVVAALLLNPVTLRPGEAMYVPAGAVHAYLSGFAVEVMASSDNVVRAGLTPKHVDVAELLRIVDCVAAPPIRLAPEHALAHTETYYAPVDDFELTVVRAAGRTSLAVPGAGPRVLLVVDGEADLAAAGTEVAVQRGSAAFVPAVTGDVHVRGEALLLQASVP
ncbi:mannose-6-phosphate isomerase, class I [Beutenbergia cavernae DSM 12333]|uniref:mannose-6-phosphate isomerase n=1 Tax=Beutenbergia cavernae (strain ATCC BAA-8 / DSM 12333 / CCUG 43141 / JCM 11478 / NBRC 16432 / NCIMB 13614 / HKI 0122) TaxID=471853 RepID=C5C128_BEUC1|nr:mannose-6-phosphate isomerase, class I [Beutenbergia cavernae]ACQ79432.1 mannose-6-phosphate isomerase, class I [Beutenbergia cavernae DSM 12333]